MKLITEGSSLSRALIKCFEKHYKFSFAVAWATAGTKVYESLATHREKIEDGVVGTHFYQTDPSVLDDFVDDDKVRFVMQPSGVFHPKVFLFRTGRSWDAFIGSANLTRGALTRNSEATLHLSDADPDSRTIRDELAKAISAYRKLGRRVRQADVDVYRAAYEHMRKDRDRLSGRYGSTTASSPLESDVMRMDWRAFVAAVRKPGDRYLSDRINLLRDIRTAFQATPRFADMDPDTRAMVAGLPNHRTTLQAYFGNMAADGYFHSAVKKNPDGLSAALDHIPLEGPVVRADYEAFVRAFGPAIDGDRERPGVASRLLAMKRPDIFVCISARNRSALADDFGISKTKIDFDAYWIGIVGRIRDARWWSHPAPTKGRELEIWEGRAAMLDAIFYEDPD